MGHFSLESDPTTQHSIEIHTEPENNIMDGKSQESKGYSGTGTRPDLNNHANQGNPNHNQYAGYTSSYTGQGGKADLNNHANQMNPNNSAYHASRGGSKK